MPKQHSFNDDGYGDCADCPLPARHQNHQVGTVPINAPDVVITQHQSPTSQAAGEAARLRSGSLRETVYKLIANAPGGMTCDEIETATGRSHQSVSSAVNTLTSNGHIRPMAEPGGPVRRETKTGHLATVWMPVRATQRKTA
jgi:hypothetical protein